VFLIVLWSMRIDVVRGLQFHFLAVTSLTLMFGWSLALISGYAATGLLLVSGAHTYEEMSSTFMPFFPLMFFPEGMLNGWIMTVLVAFRPHWVSSFDDRLYIHGK
jgi:uncharacterized membrane protein